LNNTNIILFLLKSAFVIGTVFLFSCSNDLKTVNALPGISSGPIMSAKEVHIERNDSGEIILKAYAPEILYYKNEKDTFTEFPKGLKVETFSHYPVIESSMRADYAKNIEGQKMWEARTNVVVSNYKGDTLVTELLYWNQNKKIIYSDKFCRINSQDGVAYGKNGFEADENFSRWKLKNTKGTFYSKDE
jgi:LPS export ABC transporter protein LptC